MEKDIESVGGFFTSSDMHKLLVDAEQRFKKVVTIDGEAGINDLYLFIIKSLTAIRNNYVSFERGCLFNIETIGRNFRELLEKIDTSDSDQVELLAAYLFRFIQEYEITSPQELSNELIHSLSFIRRMNLKNHAGFEMEYGQHSMLIGVLKKYLHHEEIVSIKSLPSTIERAIRLDSEIKKTLEEGQKKVKHLESALDKIKVSSDFVELVSGFSSMRSRKAIEKHFNFFCLLLLASFLTFPAAYKVYAYYAEIKTPEIDLYTAISIAALELVFVFFFRVALHNFRGIKAQILQLDLRIALLQFIQSYVKFSDGAKRQAASAPAVDEKLAKGSTLERFEQVIFSGLVSGEDNLPSTFDGLDGLAKIIAKVKSK